MYRESGLVGGSSFYVMQGVLLSYSNYTWPVRVRILVDQLSRISRTAQLGEVELKLRRGCSGLEKQEKVVQGRCTGKNLPL